MTVAASLSLALCSWVTSETGGVQSRRRRSLQAAGKWARVARDEHVAGLRGERLAGDWALGAHALSPPLRWSAGSNSGVAATSKHARGHLGEGICPLGRARVPGTERARAWARRPWAAPRTAGLVRTRVAHNQVAPICSGPTLTVSCWRLLARSGCALVGALSGRSGRRQRGREPV